MMQSLTILPMEQKMIKLFAISGAVSYPLLRSPELLSPRVRKDEIKNIILGGGQNLLSPERRFDAILVNSPDLFE